MSPEDSAVIGEHLARLSVKLENLHTDLLEVRDLAKETNGRVSRMEKWKIRTDVHLGTLLRSRETAIAGRLNLWIAVVAAIAGGVCTVIAIHLH